MSVNPSQLVSAGPPGTIPESLKLETVVTNSFEGVN